MDGQCSPSNPKPPTRTTTENKKTACEETTPLQRVWSPAGGSGLSHIHLHELSRCAANKTVPIKFPSWPYVFVNIARLHRKWDNKSHPQFVIVTAKTCCVVFWYIVWYIFIIYRDIYWLRGGMCFALSPHCSRSPFFAIQKHVYVSLIQELIKIGSIRQLHLLFQAWSLLPLFLW